MFWSRMTEPVMLCEFYSHKRGDHAVLSNFYPYEFTAIFVVRGVRHELAVANSEAAIMAAKAILFGDRASLSKIVASTDPAVAKELGRHVENFDDGIWQSHLRDIVVSILCCKFGGDLRDTFLAKTGYFAEMTRKDAVWGTGVDAGDVPSRWPGTNMLGYFLELVRHRLLEEFSEQQVVEGVVSA